MAPILALMATLVISVHGGLSDQVTVKLRDRAEPDVLADVRPHPTSKISRLERPPTAACALKLAMQVKALNKRGDALHPEHYHVAIRRDWRHESYLVRRHWR
jgi:hypothetical protein